MQPRCAISTRKGHATKGQEEPMVVPFSYQSLA
jgi:hypothetical protein